MSLSIKSMPKIDLHCHLDGSLTPEFIKKVSSVNLDQSGLIKKLQAPEDCKSLTNYLTCFRISFKIQFLVRNNDLTHNWDNLKVFTTSVP